MIELEVSSVVFAVLIALLVIIILITFKVRKRVSKKANPGINSTTPGLLKKSQEISPGIDPVIHAEPQSEHSAEMRTDKTVFETDPVIAPQINETVIPPLENKYKNLPQDSMLRRHYLTHLCTMIESLKATRPTDSVLSRHYEAMIIAEMEQCLSNESTMERLICNYEEHKKTVAQQIQKFEAVVEAAAAKPLIEPVEDGIKNEKPKLPEDSMLRRHYLTYIKALIESRMPLRPTDSTLRRHYDSMIEIELKNLL